MIRNKRSLISCGKGKDKDARKIALTILENVLNHADPHTFVREAVRRENNALRIDKTTIDLGHFEHVYVVGAGKATGRMAETLEEILGEKLAQGWINVLPGTSESFACSKIKVWEAEHPIPGEHSLRGTNKILELAKKSKKNDLVIALISGGGSALMEVPVKGIDIQRVTNSLLRSGASISELNTVRKHLSMVKGGKLAHQIYPAQLLTLVISDVVGDKLDAIASGPTVPDTTTTQEAIHVLEKYSPRAQVIGWLKRAKVPQPDARIFERTHTFLIGSNGSAIERGIKSVENVEPIILTTQLEGEAREVGKVVGSIAREIRKYKRPVERGVLVCGGETTVSVEGEGVGGRNQELVLAALNKIHGLEGVCIASIDTDGIDGPTDAAGAVCDGKSLEKAQKVGLSPEKHLRSNNSYNFFKKLNDLIFTGHTMTNVNDVCVVVVV